MDEDEDGEVVKGSVVGSAKLERKEEAKGKAYIVTSFSDIDSFSITIVSLSIGSLLSSSLR